MTVLTLVFGYCFSYNEIYKLSPILEGISGWSLINKIFPKLLDKYSDLSVIRYGSKNEKDERYCLNFTNYLQNNYQESLLELHVDDLYQINQTINLETYYQFLKECGLINIEKYKPKFMVLVK